MSTSDSFLDIARRLREQNAPRDARLLFYGQAEYAYGQRALTVKQMEQIEWLLGLDMEALEPLLDMTLGVFPHETPEQHIAG